MLKLILIWILRKFNLKKKNQFQVCNIVLKLQNMMYCIRNKNNIVNNHRTYSSRKKSNTFYVLKFLLKI